MEATPTTRHQRLDQLAVVTPFQLRRGDTVLRALDASRRAGALTVLLVALLLAPAASAEASSWTLALAGGSAGQSAAGTLGTPGGVTGTCGTGANKTSVIVSWTTVPRAASYRILQSSTSATSGFATVATGVTGTSWTSASLTTGSYWFKVVAVLGNWSGPESAATAQRTISGNSCS